MGIKENYENIQAKAPQACVVAVTKYVGPEKIIEAYNAGIRNFGEGKVQDAEQKRALLPKEIEKNIKWHFLGHLQTNKVKKITGKYEYIHSVDSVKLAKALSEEAKTKGLTQKILVQVNISEEKTKYGFTVEEIKKSLGEILELNSVQTAGLMTMAPFTNDTSIQKEVFKGLRELRNNLQKEYKTELPELSMGMSNDYPIAYVEGATIIRVGQAIFKEI